MTSIDMGGFRGEHLNMVGVSLYTISSYRGSLVGCGIVVPCDWGLKKLTFAHDTWKGL